MPAQFIEACKTRKTMSLAELRELAIRHKVIARRKRVFPTRFAIKVA